MKYILLLLIHIYWLIPKKNRKCCLFKENCSKYVYRNTMESGFKKGVKCLFQRMKKCRPNYAFWEMEDGKSYVVLADKSIVDRIDTVL